MQRYGFVFRNGDIKKWFGLEEINVVVYHAWTASRHYIRDIFLDNSTIFFTNPSEFPIGQWESL